MPHLKPVFIFFPDVMHRNFKNFEYPLDNVCIEIKLYFHIKSNLNDELKLGATD